ncbi:hypothetical protein [Streptomyces zagrosensis]|uniref:Uncharacterized protein n=1 Tax=Streptomyces zagrosensis TaxID=1042984 RepID=A0A7W9Q5P9_9ACTN|nr:hypothetical protein [Streptomyces zagrosensis]MBB5933252.1 hypothetical protein [Streptomyces zagrosensis]
MGGMIYSSALYAALRLSTGVVLYCWNVRGVRTLWCAVFAVLLYLFHSLDLPGFPDVSATSGFFGTDPG